MRNNVTGLGSQAQCFLRGLKGYCDHVFTLFLVVFNCWIYLEVFLHQMQCVSTFEQILLKGYAEGNKVTRWTTKCVLNSR